MDRPVRIGVKPWPPSAYPCFLDPNHSKRCLPGVDLEVMLTILERLGIQHYSLHPSYEPGCGKLSLDINGTVLDSSGLIGMLLNGEIDVIGITCGYTDTRSFVFDTVWPLIYDHQVFVMKTPDIEKQESSLTQPLGWQNWYAIIAVFIALIFVRIISARIFKENLKETTTKWIWNLCETTFGLDKIRYYPTGIRLHVILLFMLWQFCNSCMNNFYATEIKSATTFSSIARMPFKSAEELAALVEQGRYKLMNHIPKAPIPFTHNSAVRKRFQNGIDKFGYFYDSTANTSTNLYAPLLREPNLVYPTFDIAMQQNMIEVPFGHDLTAIRDKDGAMKPYSFYFSQNSTLLPRFNRLLGSGAQAFELVYRVRKRYLWKTALEDLDYSEFETLKLGKMDAIFKFLGAMWAISIAALVIERFYYVQNCDVNN